MTPHRENWVPETLRRTWWERLPEWWPATVIVAAGILALLVHYISHNRRYIDDDACMGRPVYVERTPPAGVIVGKDWNDQILCTTGTGSYVWSYPEAGACPNAP